MMMDREEFLDLIPAYALDALDTDERAAVEARLADDPEARRLLAEYRQIGDLLALAVPAQAAPDSLGDDLRARLAARRRPALAPSAQPAAPASPVPQKPVAPAQTAAQPTRRAWWTIALPLAAGLILVIGLLAVLQVGPFAPAADAASVYTSLAAQNGALWFRLQPGDVTETVGGTLVAAPDGSQAVIAVSGLPEIGSDQTFQLWLRGTDDVVVSGGLFRSAGEMTYVSVPLADRRLADLAGMGVSLEPAGGSPYPNRSSGPRVFAIPLTPPDPL